MCICSIKKKIYIYIFEGTGVTCEAKRTGVGGGGGRWESSLWIEQVVLQRERAAFAAALCDGDGVLDAPQPPFLVLMALRYSGRVAATVAGGAGGGVAGGVAPRLAHAPGAWRSGETGPASLRQRREQIRAGRLADTCLAVNSELARKAESKGAGATAGQLDSTKDCRAGWELLVAPPIGHHTGRDWPWRAGAGGGCASLSCTALAARGSNSSHLLIRES